MSGKKKKSNYKIFIFFLPFFILPFIIVNSIYGKETFESLIWGSIISTFVMVGGFISLKLTLNKSINLFFGALIGGIFIRLLIIFLSSFYVQRFTDLNIKEYFVFLFGYYFFLQFLEILYFNRGLKKT